MPTGKIICFKVKDSDTVGSIKVKIHRKERIRFDDQELILNEVVLDDMDTLCDKMGSTITLMHKSNGSIKIFIKTPAEEDEDEEEEEEEESDNVIYIDRTDIIDHIKSVIYGKEEEVEEYKEEVEEVKEITLYVKPNDTIGHIKSMISEYGYNSGEVLIFNETVVEDSGTVADFNIINGSTLIMRCKSRGKMKLYVNMYTGKTFSLSVRPRRTIADLKFDIWPRGDIPSDEQVLIFNNMVLEDHGTLFDYGIHRNSTITVMHKPRGHRRSMRIFIKTLPEETTITLEVIPSDTIGAVKDKIQDKAGFLCEEQELIFNEMVLSNINTVADFYITNKSILSLMHKPKVFTRFMPIFIKTLTGETITQEVKPSDTISDIKAMIVDKVDVPFDEQELIFNQMVLSDMDTVADFDINEESTLLLMRIKRGFMKLFVYSYITHNKYTLDVKPSDTVRDVKSKFMKESYHTTRNETDLFYNDELLEDSATLADYNILKESTLYTMRVVFGK